MTEITLSFSEEILKRMKKYPEIKWDQIARGAILKYIEKVEYADMLLSKSKLSIEDVEIIGNEIKKEIWEKYKKVMENE